MIHAEVSVALRHLCGPVAQELSDRVNPHRP
jgi:hypothetical protein